MDLLAGVVVIGGLVYNLCSRRCELNAINQELELLIEQIRNCEECLAENTETAPFVAATRNVSSRLPEAGGSQNSFETRPGNVSPLLDVQGSVSCRREVLILPSSPVHTTHSTKQEPNNLAMNQNDSWYAGSSILPLEVQTFNVSNSRIQIEVCDDELNENCGPFANLTRPSSDKITKNPFFNYLRCCRINRKDENYRAMVKRAAKEWNRMPVALKCQYTKDAIEKNCECWDC